MEKVTLRELFKKAKKTCRGLGEKMARVEVEIDPEKDVYVMQTYYRDSADQLQRNMDLWVGELSKLSPSTREELITAFGD